MNLCTVCSKLADKRCAKCKNTYYCSIDCQQKDFSLHKLLCAKEIQDILSDTTHHLIKIITSIKPETVSILIEITPEFDYIVLIPNNSIPNKYKITRPGFYTFYKEKINYLIMDKVDVPQEIIDMNPNIKDFITLKEAALEVNRKTQYIKFKEYTKTDFYSNEISKPK